jgi:hypothetical protein
MNDDQKDVKVDAGEEASISEPSTEEPKATEEAETQPEEAPSTEEVTKEETETKTEEASKKGASARIRELNARTKAAEEKAKSLEEQLAELTRPTGTQEPEAPYTPQVEPGQEYEPDQYRQDVLKTADAMVNLRIKQSEAVNRINLEAQQVIRRYPELDPDSDQFDRELSDSVTETVMTVVKASPYTASPKNIVERMMRPYQRAVAKEVGKATENIAKQVSGAATRPTAVSTKGGKSDSEKSIAELESELGFHN